jgi:hypothetical protein
LCRNLRDENMARACRQWSITRTVNDGQQTDVQILAADTVYTVSNLKNSCRTVDRQTSEFWLQIQYTVSKTTQRLERLTICPKADFNDAWSQL